MKIKLYIKLILIMLKPKILYIQVYFQDLIQLTYF